METPSPSTILTRALFFLGLLIAGLFLFSSFKKKQRIDFLIREAKTLSSDSSFFQQFYEADARKTLIRAIGLIAEANELGMPPSTFLDRTFGIKSGLFESTVKEEEEPRQQLIRHTLLSNYDHFRKLGYKADAQTIRETREGKLPPIPAGPSAGHMPEIVPVIDPSYSSGLDTIVANYRLQPPLQTTGVPSDVEIATAKRLARELANARIIENPTAERLIEAISNSHLHTDREETPED